MDEERDPVPPDLASRPRLGRDVAVVAVGEEAVLYREPTGELLALDATARLICEYFDGVTSIASAADELATAFGAPGQRIAGDVAAFATRLSQHGFLEPEEPNGPDGPDEP